jgi:hypothetical protein
MRQAQYREFHERGIEPFIESNELRVAIEPKEENLKQLHNACVSSKLFCQFLSASDGKHMYRLEEPKEGEIFGTTIY